MTKGLTDTNGEGRATASIIQQMTNNSSFQKSISVSNLLIGAWLGREIHVCMCVDGGGVGWGGVCSRVK